MKSTPFSITDSARTYGQTDTWPTASSLTKTAAQPTATWQEPKENGAPPTTRTWYPSKPSLITGTAGALSQKENCPTSGSYGKTAYATIATWREGEESFTFPAPRSEDTPKPPFVTDNTGTPGQTAAKLTSVQQQKGNLLSSGPQINISHAQSLATETTGTKDTGSHTEKTHSKFLPSETASAQDSLFVDDKVPEGPKELSIPGHLIAEPYTEMVWIGDKVPKVTLKLVAPPHPGTSTLLFRKWNGTPVDNEPHARYWQLGSTPDNASVDSPRPEDIVLDYSPDNIKILAHVFFKLRHRRGELRRAWFRANKHARDIVAITPDPYAELPNRVLSAAARNKLDQFIPAKISVVVPAARRQGGINRRERGSIVERRVLFLRGTPVVKKGEETCKMAYRTRGDDETKLTPEDVVLPKDEDTFLALYRFYSKIQDADIIVPNESKKRPASTLLSFDDVTKKAKLA
ncbi:hypothetical protein GE09DRAFT_1124728 [Coniochaeta sp. 2T2.1]|nr:hypothetical protein GE09DRAFT_1124728 [Coniochaeta sp. 2T2.1]